MPVNMLQSVCCDTCRESFRRIDMSIFDGVCKNCFARRYQLCTECGLLLRTSRNDRHNAPSGQDAHFYNDLNYERPLCYNCYTRIYPRSHRWNPTPFGVSFATYQRIGSRRKYGVEIETDSCGGFEELEGETTFGCKSDCSIGGLEFPSPVLYGDEGLAEIEGFLAIAAEKNWSADCEDCGCHTHYDVRDDTEEELYRITYAYAKSYYRFWGYCVSNERRDNTYCHEPSYTTNDVRRGFDGGRQFGNFWSNFDRYDYVNIGAWHTHKTFEVRLLEGTIDSTVICNWITIHCRFMDYVKRLSFDNLDLLLSGNTNHILSAIAVIVGDTDLSDWLAERIRTFLN